MLNVILLGIRFVILVLAGHKEIALENAALRQQLAVFKRDINRPRLRRRDRIFWMGLRAIWKDWKSALMIVRPETVISWQRKRFNRYWWRLSQPKGPGRPRLSAEIRNLITTMAAANPLWGAPRIHGELLKLGVEISERTVSRLIPKQNKEPSQTWKTFLTNHVGQLVSIDFFTVPTLQLRVLFVLVVLAHERRRVLHFNVTEHPNAEWTAQQIIGAFPEDAAPRYLIRDRDGIYGSHFRNRVQGMRIQEVLAPQSIRRTARWKHPSRMPQSSDRARPATSEMDIEKILRQLSLMLSDLSRSRLSSAWPRAIKGQMFPSFFTQK